MTVLTSAHARLILVVALIVFAPVVGLAGLAMSAQAATDDPKGVGITVGVVGPSSRATVAPSVTSPVKSATVSAVTQTTITDSAAAASALGEKPTKIAGVFYVSGLTTHIESEAGPGGGTAVLDFTVRNITDAPITSSLRFWLDNAVGLPVALVDKVGVDDLAPNETRTVTATLPDVGQWTWFTGHVTMTLPADIGGTAIPPFTRDSFTLIPPYFALIVLAVAGTLTLILRFVLLAPRTAPELAEEVAS
ncbi:hypothetical protein E3O44_16340 [Cryobacterium algoricola]|uniref:DUF916 domain-containing protein n=1 Tax=Cryobacterium algoricola TaxID=1259183 RepID=A0ABY2IAY6_9MICO|nr:hypothetical protein [Cryobacterium algoricola]TFB84055.1 hypothetical protein E3O44_16340 [Cryobacterium algoricola]